MAKVDLKQIFKNGENFKLKNVDWRSPKVRASFKRVKEEQEKSRRRREVDWAALAHWYINI